MSIRSRSVNDYPAMIVQVNHVEPVPRRVRAFLADETVFDTTHALYVWEWPNYPQYYIPLADVRPGLLIPEGHTQTVEELKETPVCSVWPGLCTRLRRPCCARRSSGRRSAGDARRCGC